MTDLQIWQPSQGEIAQYQTPSGPLDDWITVADKVVNLANVIANSPFVPDGLRGSVPAVAAAILTGRELQIPPMTSLANIHVIHGRPGLSALVMRALVLSHGHEWRDVEVTNTRVVLEGRRKGSSDWTRASFSADDASRAKIQLGGYPQDKLYARATSRLARRAFADVIAGMPYSIEELEDGVTEDEATAPADGAPKPAAPAARTAQRKQRTQSSPPAQAATPSAASATTHQADAGGDLPPLPGEDEPADAAGTPGDEKHRKLVGTVQAHFKRLGYTDEDRDERLRDAAQVARVSEITSLTDLTHEELSAVADTLSRCRDKDRLKLLLVERDDPRGGTEDE